jgi:hypothetical protein
VGLRGEQLEGCRCDVDHRANEGGRCRSGVANVAQRWALGRACISRLNQDVRAGDFEAAYIETFRHRLRRGCRLIASQLAHQGKDTGPTGHPLTFCYSLPAGWRLKELH